MPAPGDLEPVSQGRRGLPISGVTTSEFPAQSEFPSKGGGKEVRGWVEAERHMTAPGDPEPVLGLVSSGWVNLTPKF